MLKEGVLHEIDVIGEYPLYNGYEDNRQIGAWFVSVRYRAQKMGEKAVEEFMNDVAALQSEKQYGKISLWYFSQAGFTKDAQTRMRAENIYFSDLEEFNKLADLFDLLYLSM